MATNWRESTVIELQKDGRLQVEDGNHGEYRPRHDEFVDKGVAFIRAADMDNGRVDFNSASKINDIALKRITKGIGAGGDVLLSHKGTVGKIASVPLDAPAFVCSPQTTFWRTLDENIIDRRYLYVYMRSEHFRRQLDSRKGETDMADYVSLTAQRGLKVLLPPIKEQRAIAGILGSLDDKIELNRRINRTLESITQKIFNQWFTENEKVEGWEAGKFNGISDISRDSVNPGQYPNEVFNYYSIPAYDEKHFPVSELGNQIKSNKFVVPNNCVLISKLNPETPRIWLPFNLENRSICSTEFLVNIPKGYFSAEYLYGLFYSQSFQDRFISMVTGTSGSHQRVKAEYVLNMDIELPSENLVSKYTETVKPLLQKVQQNILESRTLASLRDSLLPKLMRGEVRVK